MMLKSISSIKECQYNFLHDYIFCEQKAIHVENSYFILNPLLATCILYNSPAQSYEALLCLNLFIVILRKTHLRCFCSKILTADMSITYLLVYQFMVHAIYAHKLLSNLNSFSLCFS